MKFIVLLFLLFLGFTSASYSQSFKIQKYSLMKTYDSTKNGFYLKPNNPTPFSPVLDVYFGIYDSSSVELYIINDKSKDTIFTFNDILTAGDYVLDWWSENVKEIKIGVYYFIIIAECKKRVTLQSFKASQMIIYFLN